MVKWVLELEIIKDKDDVSKKYRHKRINTVGRSQNTYEALQMRNEEAPEKNDKMLWWFAM